MPRKLIECVANFSEGKDAKVVEQLADAVRSVPGSLLLDLEMDADHNRCVLTFAGPPEAVAESAIRAVGEAVRLIDLTKHSGVHPRIGAADVVPFVPVEGVTLEECAQLAVRVGQELWARFQLPVYLYEAAARRPERVNLENIRRGQFEGLREEVRVNADRKPDIGEAQLHPTAGATVVGARKFLIAYNINLTTSDVGIARKIARAVRYSSGGYRYVKAMGVMLHSRNRAQVSMNLTDFEQTPVHRVFETVKREAERYGANISGSEIIGLIPRKAIEHAADFYLRCEDFHSGVVLENRIAEATSDGGLEEFLTALAAPSATPGGGSAAAASGAMAAALGSMVAGLARLSTFNFEPRRRFFTEAVQRDADGYGAVVAAYGLPKAERVPPLQAAMRQATLVPLEVAEQAGELIRVLKLLADAAPPKVASDVITAQALAAACLTGALANVRINLPSLVDGEFRSEVERRLAVIRASSPPDTLCE